MNTPFTYEFGYSWPVTWLPAVPLAVFGILTAVSYWLGWRAWITIASGLLAAWAIAALIVLHGFIRINMPMELPTGSFMASGGGEVLDVGAGSGRFTVGALLARPDIRVTAVDLYDGYWGIDDNTPDRLMRNARIAGVDDRASARVGDARALPAPDEAYDGVISSYAIDHLRRDEIPTALAEAKRVLKPGGEFLLAVVNVDWWVLLTSPPIAHHPPADPARWQRLLEEAGFTIEEQGTRPGTLYFLVRKPAERQDA